MIGSQRLRLWLVGEYTNGQPGNRYWLDETRRIRLSHWRGAVSHWVATRDEALSNLPTELVEYARELFSAGNDSDWTAAVEKWLGQNE